LVNSRVGELVSSAENKSPIHQVTNSPIAVILFDGVCSLCDRSVQFIIQRDPAARFRFGALQSEPAQRLLASVGRSSPATPETFVLLEDNRVFTRSTAALRIVRRLPFPWPLAYGFIVIPRALRDAIYDWVARHRYRWFGRLDQCLMPTPERRRRFID
jgi:predicted DCC family thiol-disulfide oxidoreductase YuxK